MNLLFVCSANKLRSATAETVFCSEEGIDVIGAGTNKDAPTTIDSELIEWADIIFVMENSHKRKVTKEFSQSLKDKRIIVLDIPDNYKYMQDELVELLKFRVGKLLGRDFD